MTADEEPLGWDTATVADAYRDRDMRLAEQLVFPAVLRRLEGRAGPGRLALDIGCGTGAVAARLASTGEWEVQGLDPSADMLGIARADRPHPRVSYRLFDGRTLDRLADDSVDAAVCCLVYCTDPDDGRLAALTAEIRRVLRPAAPYLLADLNPAATGVAFSTLRHGEPGAVYGDGDTVPTLLRLRDGTMMTSATYYRSIDRYRRFLTEAGFPAPAVELPTLPAGDPGSSAVPAEIRTAPYMILATHA
ncbi:class I SAM-dependent methyltransferase [Streptomyces sp. WELS2]|uniref:class I SAM-dependent methyltransferase n=1 Tax=Streptomyces sp. WELS2 TaxID=2749435 RepID=UPI0015EFFCAC|nr:class I SAM-dependent methyltransferase [Streptomyces sp. WELS2]